jgi:hypothetical protein
MRRLLVCLFLVPAALLPVQAPLLAAGPNATAISNTPIDLKPASVNVDPDPLFEVRGSVAVPIGKLHIDGSHRFRKILNTDQTSVNISGFHIGAAA